MPQRISIVYICSLCASETDDAGKVTAYQILGPGKPLNFDICTACAEVGPFRDIMEKGLRDRGAKPAPAKGSTAVVAEQAGGRMFCEAGCGLAFTAPQGKAAHERWCGKSPAEVEKLKASMRASRAKK